MQTACSSLPGPVASTGKFKQSQLVYAQHDTVAASSSLPGPAVSKGKIKHCYYLACNMTNMALSQWVHNVMNLEFKNKK